MLKLWWSAEMVSMKILQGIKALLLCWMQYDNQAFHMQWKALLQSVVLSFTASKYSQYRQIPYMAGYPAYMNMGTLNTQAASSSVAFFFNLYLGLCSPTEFYKTGIQSKSNLKVRSGPKRTEQAIYLSLWISKGVRFLNYHMSRITKERKPGDQTGLHFFFQWWWFRSMGFRYMTRPLLQLSFFFSSFWGWTEKRLQLIRPESAWAGKVSSYLLTTPSAGKVPWIPDPLTLLSQDLPWVGLYREQTEFWGWGIPEQGIKQVSPWQEPIPPGSMRWGMQNHSTMFSVFAFF